MGDKGYEEYEVIWRLNLSARSPEEAAELAREIQLEEHNMATVFNVFDKDGNEEVIDLFERQTKQATLKMTVTLSSKKWGTEKLTSITDPKDVRKLNDSFSRLLADVTYHVDRDGITRTVGILVERKAERKDDKSCETCMFYGTHCSPDSLEVGKDCAAYEERT